MIDQKVKPGGVALVVGDQVSHGLNLEMLCDESSYFNGISLNCLVYRCWCEVDAKEVLGSYVKC